MADVQKDIVLRVKSETDQATGQFKNLKQELRSIENELNKMAEAGQTGTAAFNKLQQRAGEVKDQIGDTKNAIKALSSDTFKLDAFAQGAQGIAGGFAAAQGAMALFGTENKAVEEAIKKTQGAMALLQGVTAITNILQKDSAFSLAFLSKAQTENAVATNVATTATKGFSRALIATGIGAIIVLIGTLVAYWDDLKEAVGGVSKETENYIEKSKLDTEQAEKKYNLTKDTENVLKLQGKSQREILNIKIKETDAIIIGIKNQIKGQQMATKQAVEASKRNQEIAKGVIMALFSPIKALTLMVDGLINGLIETANFFGADIDFKLNLSSFDQLLAETIFDPEKVAEEGKKTEEELQKSLDKITNEQAGFKLEIQKLDQEDKKKREEAEKKAQEAEEKARKDKEQKDEELKKKLEQNAKDFQDRTNKEYEDSKKSSDAYYDHLINNAKLNGQSTEELELQKLQNLLQIQKDYGLSTVEIEDQIALKKKEISDKQLEQQRAQLEIQRQDYSQSYNQIKTILDNAYKTGLITQKQYNEATKQLDSAQLQGKMALTKAVADLFGSLSDALGKETKAGKALATAQALINTYLGISEVLRAKNPYPEPFGTAVKIASAATIGINGFNTVRSINKVQVPGGGGGGPVGSMPNLSTAPSAMATTTPTIGSTQLQLDAQGNLQQGSMRTYVLETDISDKQKRSQRLQRTATLGK
jgi:hypothetical protein